MLPYIQQEAERWNNTPLDTTAYVGLKGYNFFKRKKGGIYKVRLNNLLNESVYGTNTTLASTKNSDHTLPLKMPKSRTCSVSPNRHHITKKCCLDAVLCSHHTSKKNCDKKLDVFNKASAKLTRHIFNNNRDDEKKSITSGKIEGTKKYSSRILRDVEKWGPSTQHTVKKCSTFGRILRRQTRNNEVKGYSKDSLQRLAFGDLKMYYDNKESFIGNYAEMLIKQLLVRSNEGAKFRTPVSFN